MKHGTAYIQPEDRPLLNRLRLKEYHNAKGFQIKDAAVLWNESDDQAHVLGVWRRGELISSMRLEIIRNRKTLERKLETEIPADLKIDYPVGILSKAVTSAGFQGAGLNAHLRYHLFKVALQNGVSHIFGTLVKGAPRSKSLKDMGYTFYAHPTGWTSPYYKSTSDVEIVYLNLAENGRKAIEACARLASDSLLFYPWIRQQQEKSA